MKTEKKLAIMQNMYASSVAETVNTYAQLNVLNDVVAARKKRQPQSAPIVNSQLGVEKIEDVFSLMTEVFGCANWTVEETSDGFIATTTFCKLCALSKKMGGANPCDGWCLDPIRSMVMAIDNKLSEDDFDVEETLMDGSCCKVQIHLMER